MFRVLSCLAVEHDLRLVVLAGIVCFLASTAAVSLFHRAKATNGRARALWTATAGAATGSGIWATHFIAMLAYEPGTSIAYGIGLTSLSLVAAASVTAIGLGIAIYGRSRWNTPLGGAVVGGGVACMHYLGMAAVEIPGRVTWLFDYVLVSIVVGMLFGMWALKIAVRRDDIRTTLAAAALLTLAIVSHHFTAMGAVVIVADPTRTIDALSMSPTALALAIAGVAVAILSMSLIGAISDRRLAVRADDFARDRRQLIEESEEMRREQHLRLSTAISNMSQGLLMFDADGRLLVCNDRYIDMYGLPREVVKPGCSFDRLLEVRKSNGTFPGSIEDYRNELSAALAHGKSYEKILELNDGRTMALVHQPMSGGGWVTTDEDVTERRHAEKQIAYMAHHDLLTDLPNRAAFTDHFAAVLDNAIASGGTFAVVCIDLDRFKEVNDVFGHSVGDGLLREVSRLLRRAAGDAFLARLGGDEFTLIVAEGQQPATAERLAEALQAALADDVAVDDHRLHVGLSIGVAIFPTDGKTAAALLANADAALYRAKAEGRGAIRFFEADMDKRLRERRALQHDLRSAIERGQLSLHYQPQVRMDGSAIGFEALVRWEHPARGTVPPANFIPLAEESGTIIPIGQWILREACREAASWPRPLQIAVNLSPVQFRHGDLPGFVHSVLLETGLPAGRLELEITEGVLIGDFSRAVSILRRLKALGVRIAMDDFGTGYSSLSYLQAFPFDKIKIDQAFISNLDRNVQSTAIIRAVIGLGHGLSLPVSAEGVETKEQMNFLKRESCDEVQGFLFGRPQPIEAYAHLVGREAPAPKQMMRAG
ncbi:MAG: EAL domain-containing protein [Hyphomicrobiales bacterium]|nr:EAL domain-containing protein [Hyphomicrobiales bacterium]